VAHEILMPKWGLTMKEGKVSRWLKAEGDTVAAGEPLLEVETSKITNVVESPGAGVLFQIVVAAGETVPVQTVLAVLAQPGETPQRREAVVRTDAGQPETGAADAGKAAANGKGEFVPATPAARRLAKDWGIELGRVTGTGPKGRVTEADVQAFKERADATPAPAAVNASDSAVAAAKRAGIDIARVRGTGPGGRITKADVLRAASRAAKTPGAASARIVPGMVIPMDGMRRIIAENMMASLHNAAQLSAFVEMDATALVAFRDKARRKYEAQDVPRVSVNDIIALGVCRALVDHPVMNSRLEEAGISVCADVNLGIAVALENGLVVPNLKAAQTLSLMDLARQIRDPAQKARENRLTMDEIQGGTFTITNVSMLGVDGFTPILNPPETAILGVGRTVDRPAVHKGEIVVRTMMTLSLTFDHRVVDGAPAMRFLRTLADYLEDPVMIQA